MQILRYILVLMALSSSVYAEENRDIVYDDFQLHNARATTHDGSFVSVDYSNTIGFDVSISGTSATVVFRISGAGKFGWQELSCFPSDSETSATSTTTSGFYTCNIAGGDAVSARVDECTSCSVSVVARRTTAVLGGGGGGGGGGAGTLDQAFDGGKVIDGANSLANAFRVGDGTTPMCQYTDATLGPVIRPCTDSNTRTFIWTNFTWCWYDIEGDACMFTVDPDGTDNDKYTWASGYRPIKTIPFPADALYPRGSSTLVTDTALISGGLISPYITTTDSDSDGFYRYIVMDPKWDGGTVTGTVTVVNVNATPANAYVVGISGECYPAGTVIPTTISATGVQNATVTFGSSGSCGVSACSQNDPASATTAAITLNGTPAGGNLCGFQGRTSASGTTETVAGIKIIQMDIHYKIAKGF